MNYREMVDWHRLHRADITIATIQVAPQEADRFGIAEIDRELSRSWASRRSPSTATRRVRPSIPEMVSASMGIYVFNTDGAVAPVAGGRAESGLLRTISART